ncbi:MAG: gliding motility-associated C-terminal domain-containing protein, partial [Marinirhabdus sp.]|nr:gliding motility-associated C-terminal domain-containing protein [Marinirhabdus sp.]
MKKLLLLLLLFPAVLFSQPVDLFQQFNGRLDFTAFGNTLNTAENGAGAPCTILTQSSANYALLPGQTFESAHLYWSGPGSGDFDVELNGIPVTASRQFSLVAGTGLEYFAAYADVSNIVGPGGSGLYTLSELDLTGVIGAYCSGGTNFGGWSIIVIYEDLSLTLNQISLFDGLDFVSASNNSLEIVLNNIDVATDDLAKIGFLAWEGDQGIANNETLLIEGVLIDNPPLNPGNNAFNGTNSYTGANDLYNMDLDVYDLEGIVMPGSTEITINLTSNQDFVMVNNLITSVNSEIPDATIVIDNLGVLCQNRDINVNYTVFNVNSTAFLPANTPIAFYIDNVLVGQTQTVADIPIDGSESGTITLNVPLGTPVNFDLKAVVDDIGDGTGIVSE